MMTASVPSAATLSVLSSLHLVPAIADAKDVGVLNSRLPHSFICLSKHAWTKLVLHGIVPLRANPHGEFAAVTLGAVGYFV